MSSVEDNETLERTKPSVHPVSSYSAMCDACEMSHPCIVVAGVVVFAPEQSINCNRRGEPTRDWNWKTGH